MRDDRPDHRRGDPSPRRARGPGAPRRRGRRDRRPVPRPGPHRGLMSFIPGVGAIVPALLVGVRRRGAPRARPDARRPPVLAGVRAGRPTRSAAGQPPSGPARRRARGGRRLPAGGDRRRHPRRSTGDTGSWSSRRSVGPQELGALLIGGLVAAAIGFLDDVLQIRARWQLAGQLAVALVRGRARWRPRSTSIANPFGPGTIRSASVFAWAFTVLWIVGMINSINFIDGLDGLSSGIALIAARDARPDQPDDGGRRRSASRSSPCCASSSPDPCSGSCAGTSTRRRSSSGRAA